MIGVADYPSKLSFFTAQILHCLVFTLSVGAACYLLLYCYDIIIISDKLFDCIWYLTINLLLYTDICLVDLDPLCAYYLLCLVLNR